MKKTFEINTSSKELIVGLNRLIRECNTPTGNIDKGITALIKAYCYDEMSYVMEWYSNTIDKSLKELGYDFKKAVDIKRKLVKLYTDMVDDEVADLKNSTKKRKVNFEGARLLLYEFDRLSRPFCDVQSYPRNMELSIQWLILIYEKRLELKERTGSNAFFNELRDILSYYNCIYHESEEKRKERKKRLAEKEAEQLKASRPPQDTATDEHYQSTENSESNESNISDFDLDSEEL
ncbi:MAG: hypothetical protein J1G38_02275 [Clostridiales bacterium]|nr:hypothetical protein [Clostridiales bacterium]